MPSSSSPPVFTISETAARALTEALLREASGDPATLPKLADCVPARSLRRSNPPALAVPGQSPNVAGTSARVGA